MTTKPLKRDEVRFAKWNADTKRFVQVTRRGRLFTVAGVDVVLFPVSVLADAIWRHPKTIGRWEKHNGWPHKIMWRVPDKKCRRWYSREQILAIAAKHSEIAGGLYGNAHSRHFDLPGFIQYVRDNFYRFDHRALQAMKEDNDNV